MNFESGCDSVQNEVLNEASKEKEMRFDVVLQVNTRYVVKKFSTYLIKIFNIVKKFLKNTTL